MPQLPPCLLFLCPPRVRFVLCCASLVAALGLPTGGFAQPAIGPAIGLGGSAVAEARARVVCGSGTVVSATYLPGGLLQATCQSRSLQNSAQSASVANEAAAQLRGTGLASPGIGAASLLGAVALGVAVGGGDQSITTEGILEETPQ